MPRQSRDLSAVPINPHYLETWTKAAYEPPLTIPMSSKHAATRLRALLYTTRKILQAQDHELCSLIDNLSISIQQNPWRLVIGTADLEIMKDLAAIGIGAPEAPDFED